MTERAGAWMLGIGLGLFAAIGVLGLPWAWQEAMRQLAAVTAAIGLALTTHGIAWRLGLGGLGAGLSSLGLASGLVNALTDLDALATVAALALLTVGLPILVRAVVDRTGFLGVPALFGAVGLAGLGAATTAVVAQRSVTMPAGVTKLLDLAVVLGVLAGAVSSGMVVATRHTGPAQASRARTEGLPAHSSREGSAPAGPGEPAAAAEELSAGGSALSATASEPPATAIERSGTATLTPYQRLTLLVTIVGAVLSAVIGLTGSVLAALLSR